jgi:hypothetical protein
LDGGVVIGAVRQQQVAAGQELLEFGHGFIGSSASRGRLAGASLAASVQLRCSSQLREIAMD